jgi:hypothetical protein
MGGGRSRYWSAAIPGTRHNDLGTDAIPGKRNRRQEDAQHTGTGQYLETYRQAPPPVPQREGDGRDDRRQSEPDTPLPGLLNGKELLSSSPGSPD